MGKKKTAKKVRKAQGRLGEMTRVLLDEAQRFNKPTPEQMPHEVPANVETFVPKGMVAAPGVIPHPDQATYPGVLVMQNDHTVVVRWHNRGCARASAKLDPARVVFDQKGAPWCPTCFAENVARDPNWNQPVDTVTEVPEPINSPADPNRVSRQEQERRAAAAERLRAARDAGQFRDPAAESVIGDDKKIDPEILRADMDYKTINADDIHDAVEDAENSWYGGYGTPERLD